MIQKNRISFIIASDDYSETMQVLDTLQSILNRYFQIKDCCMMLSVRRPNITSLPIYHHVKRAMHMNILRAKNVFEGLKTVFRKSNDNFNISKIDP